MLFLYFNKPFGEWIFGCLWGVIFTFNSQCLYYLPAVRATQTRTILVTPGLSSTRRIEREGERERGVGERVRERDTEVEREG